MAINKEPDQTTENGKQCIPRYNCLERMANSIDPDQTAENGK